MLGSIMDWTALFQQAYKALKPGGYIESFEPSSCFESDDVTIVEGSPLHQWGQFFREGGRKMGRPFTVYEDGIQTEAMRQAGFVEIEERVFKASIKSIGLARQQITIYRIPLVVGRKIQSCGA
jgi:hypothetical protein